MDNKSYRKQIFLCAWAIAWIACAGCIGAHYSKHELLVNGKEPPEIRGPKDPAIEANLSTNAWPKSPLPDRAAEVVVTLAKSAGIQGWKDYHLHAKATGTVIQHEFSSNGFLTMDLRLKSLVISHTSIPLHGPRYMRLEIFLGKVDVDKGIYTNADAHVVAEGKFVWDSDGWFEIHPQHTGDVRFAPPSFYERFKSFFHLTPKQPTEP